VTELEKSTFLATEKERKKKITKIILQQRA
jgi:hypothetical protein